MALSWTYQNYRGSLKEWQISRKGLQKAAYRHHMSLLVNGLASMSCFGAIGFHRRS